MLIEVDKVNEPKIVIKIDDNVFAELTKEQAEALRDKLCEVVGEPQCFSFVYRIERPIFPNYRWTCAS